MIAKITNSKNDSSKKFLRPFKFNNFCENISVLFIVYFSNLAVRMFRLLKLKFESFLDCL